MGRHFGRGKPALVDFIPFCDRMAEFIGCAPNLTYWMFMDPVMFCHMIFGVFQPCQYRLEGPGACFGKSRKIILETPYYADRRNRFQRYFFVVVVSFWCALLGL